jgi:N6-L-threonylcarbamoyladenine synthase
MLVLGIETSCDETAAAVVENGNKILSNIISSQIDVHKEYGGVVPELASRHHIQNIQPVVELALKKADVKLNEVDAFAVTYGPGLVGSLLVGLSFAKALAYAFKKPLIGINHIEGHIQSVFLQHQDIELPALTLVVSGGHTTLFYMPEWGIYKVVGRHRDDAAGEAFDKVAKMLELGYPGGPIIDDISDKGDAQAIRFPIAKISDGSLDFSFSGIKTAVLRHVQKNMKKAEDLDEENIYDIAASFQYTVIKTLIKKIRAALKKFRVKSISISGGVACNRLLRKELKSLAENTGKQFYYPNPILSTDNAAMIASMGYFKLRQGERSALDLDADPSLILK